MPTLKELRNKAKEAEIVGYSTKNKAQLIDALELLTVCLGESGHESVKKETVKDLRAQAKSLGIRGSSVAKKAQLVQMIAAHGSGEAFELPETTSAEPVEPVETVEPSEPVAKKARKQSTWHAFLASYRNEHKCSQKEAMSAKEEYYSHFLPSLKAEKDTSTPVA